MKRLGVFLLVASSVGLLGLSSIAVASIVRAMALDELATRAEQILVGDVVSVRADWDASHRTIYSTIDIAVQESWKGTPPSDGRIRLRQKGGTVGDIEMTVYGMPAFSAGERSLLFLERNGVVGMSQGKRRMHQDPNSGRWVVEPAERRGLSLVGGAATSQVPSEELETMRAKVRVLLGK
jgi:hypothetical protein